MAQATMRRYLFRIVERLYGKGGVHETCYLTRVKLTPSTRAGGLYLHIFHRGDADPDPHDHPWPFVTFPLVTYLEAVFEDTTTIQSVQRFRFHYRHAEHTHRVLKPRHGDGMIVSLVWHFRKRRAWGFWVEDADRAARVQRLALGYEMSHLMLSRISRGNRMFMPWRDYIFNRHDQS